MRRWAPPLVLWAAALCFGYFGVVFFLDPAGWVGLVDLGATTPLARTEVRAMYGGLEVGLALFLVTCAQRLEWWRMGLLLSTLCFLSLATARSVSLAMEGLALTPLLWLVLATEIGLATLSLLTLRLATGDSGDR